MAGSTTGRSNTRGNGRLGINSSRRSSSIKDDDGSSSSSSTRSRMNIVHIVGYAVLLAASFVNVRRSTTRMTVLVPPPIDTTDDNMQSTAAAAAATKTTIGATVPTAAALPPVHYNGTWIGTHWMPSSAYGTDGGYKLFTPGEMAEYYKDHSVLVIGDSTARRLYATMYAILERGSGSTEEGEYYPDDIRVEELDDPSIVDVNKKSVTEVCNQTVGPETTDKYTLCRTTPGSAGFFSSSSLNERPTQRRRFDLLTQTCLGGLTEILRRPGPQNKTDAGGALWPDLHHYSVVIIAMGAWELGQNMFCGKGRLNTTELVLQTFEEYAKSSSSTSVLPRIVWRTWIGHGSDTTHRRKAAVTHQYADAFNQHFKRRIDKLQHDRYVESIEAAKNGIKQSVNDRSIHSVSYVDWGHIMKPRAWPQHVRIEGDLDEHIGLDGRLAMIQATTNHLKEQDRQQHLQLAPWAASGHHNKVDHGDYYGGDCRVASPHRRPEYCLTSQQRREAHEAFLDVAIPDPPMTLDEQATYMTNQRRFCRTCIWNDSISCEVRLLFVIHTYGGPRHAHLDHMLKEEGTACIQPNKRNNETPTF